MSMLTLIRTRQISSQSHWRGRSLSTFGTKFEHFRGGDLLQGHFMQPQQQSTNKSGITRAHSINTLTTGLTSDQIGGQARTSSSSSTNSLGENANTRGDPQWAYRSGMTPNELCLSRDVFRLGKPPAELSRKEAIQTFVTSSRQIGTHREFEMEPMLFAKDEIAVLMEFQKLNVSKTGSARKYFTLQVMYEISQRYWTLGEVDASYRSFVAKVFLSRFRTRERPIRQPKDAKENDSRLMAAVGNLAKRMMEYGDKIKNKINSTGDLTYSRMPDYDVVLLVGNNSDMKSDFEGDTFDIQRVHIDANYKFDVIPPEVDALLTDVFLVDYPTISIVDEEVKDGPSEDSDQEAPSKRQRTADSELAARAALAEESVAICAPRLDGAGEAEC